MTLKFVFLMTLLCVGIGIAIGVPCYLAVLLYRRFENRHKWEVAFVGASRTRPTKFRDVVGYLVMAIGGCLSIGCFMYVKFVPLGANAPKTESLFESVEGTAILMSGILLSGAIYYRLLGDRDEARSVQRLLSWRVQSFHLITIALLVADGF